MAQIADFISTASDLEKKKKMGQYAIAPETLARVPGLSSVGMPETNLPEVTFGGQARPDGTQAYPFNQTADQKPMGIGERVDNFFGTAMRALTPKEELGYTPPTIGDVAASAGIRSASGGIIGDPERMEPRYGPQAIAQSPFAPQATVTPQAEQTGLTGQPTPFQLPENVQEGSPQAFFLQRQAEGRMGEEEIARGYEAAKRMGTTFDPETGFSRQPFLDFQRRGQPAQQGSTMSIAETQARLAQLAGQPEGSRMTLNQYLSSAPDAGMSYDVASAAREARIRQTVGLGTAVSDRERRRTGEMSMEAATRLTGGDRKAARALIERQRQGMGEFAQPQDNRTPEQVEQERLQNERMRQIIEQGNKPDATDYEKKAAELTKGVQNGTITQAQADDALKRHLLGNPPSGYNSWAEYEASTGVDADGDGKVATAKEAESASGPSIDPTKLSGQDKAAYEWAQKNPDDPRAAKILERLSK